jgi:hypothetical protein
MDRDRKRVLYTRAQIKRTTTVTQTFVPPFVAELVAFVGTGKVVPVGFAGREELVWLVGFVGRDVFPVSLVGCGKFGLLLEEIVSPDGLVSLVEIGSPDGFVPLVGVPGPGEFAVSVGTGGPGEFVVGSGGF